jgi:hypothetical protein
VGHPKARRPKVETESAITGSHVDIHVPVIGAYDRVRQHPPRRFHMLRAQRHAGRVELVLQGASKVTSRGDIWIVRIVEPVHFRHRPIMTRAALPSEPGSQPSALRLDIRICRDPGGPTRAAGSQRSHAGLTASQRDHVLMVAVAVTPGQVDIEPA